MIRHNGFRFRSFCWRGLDRALICERNQRKRRQVVAYKSRSSNEIASVHLGVSILYAFSADWLRTCLLPALHQ
ncbi:MAG: hypothetical protein EAZ21_04180 [Betaproteobacteria bacterium]|nr:MAG: hypothetical protein EAZ21_04180 [Betaproteobacteria bacterium]